MVYLIQSRLSCLDSSFIAPNTFKSFGFPICPFWAYLMKVILSVPDEGYFERTWWRLFWAYLMKVILSVPDEGYFERTWWRLFQKRVVRTKFEMYVFISQIKITLVSYNMTAVCIRCPHTHSSSSITRPQYAYVVHRHTLRINFVDDIVSGEDKVVYINHLKIVMFLQYHFNHFYLVDSHTYIKKCIGRTDNCMLGNPEDI